MRLLDQITQHALPLFVSQLADGVTRTIRLPGAADYAAHIAGCPLRYVLDDDLTAVCAELALAGGDRLSGCLDLIHLPAASLWLEWNDVARERVLNGGHSVVRVAHGSMQRAGALIRADADGRRAVLHSFWTDSEHGPCLAPVETHLDLSCQWPAGGSLQSAFAGGLARVTVSDDPGLEALLDCMRFRFQPQWAAYYRDARLTSTAQVQLLHASLATVARDMPVVLALSLLLGHTRHSRPGASIGSASTGDGEPSTSVRCSITSR